MTIAILFLVLALPGFAANVALVQHSTTAVNTCGFTSGVMTCSFPGNVTADAAHPHLEIIGIGTRSTTTGISVSSISLSGCASTPTLLSSSALASNTAAWIYGCIVTSTTAETVSVTLSGAYARGWVTLAEYSDATITMAAATGASGNSTTINCGTLTVAANNTMLVGFNYINVGAGSYNPPSGWTSEVKLQDATVFSAMLADKFQATAATTSPVFTNGNSGVYSCVAVAIPSYQAPPHKRATEEWQFNGNAAPDWSMVWFSDQHPTVAGVPWKATGTTPPGNSEFAINNEAVWNTKAYLFSGDLNLDGPAGFYTHGWNNIVGRGLPTIASPGNHDCNVDDGYCATRASSIFDAQVGYSQASGATWGPVLAFSGVGNDVGAYNDVSLGSHSNYATRFAVNQHKFLVISLEIYPRVAVMTWAANLAAVYPNHQVIYVTHGYINQFNRPCLTTDVYCGQNSSGGVACLAGDTAGYCAYTTSGQDLYDNLIKTQANSFISVSGHFPDPLSSRVVYGQYFSTGTNGNPIYGFYEDYQNYTTTNDAVVQIVFHEQTKTFDVIIWSAQSLSPGADARIYKSWLGNVWPQL